jgi:hypothetical protein
MGGRLGQLGHRNEHLALFHSTLAKAMHS